MLITTDEHCWLERIKRETWIYFLTAVFKANFKTSDSTSTVSIESSFESDLLILWYAKYIPNEKIRMKSKIILYKRFIVAVCI